MRAGDKMSLMLLTFLGQMGSFDTDLDRVVVSSSVNCSDSAFSSFASLELCFCYAIYPSLGKSFASNTGIGLESELF